MRGKLPIYPNQLCTEWLKIYYRENAKLNVDCVSFAGSGYVILMRLHLCNRHRNKYTYCIHQFAIAARAAAATAIKSFIGTMHTEFRCEFHNFI